MSIRQENKNKGCDLLMLLNPHEVYTDSRIKHLQVVFLGLHEKMPINKIMEFTNYTRATVKRYLDKFKTLLEEATNTFFHTVEIIVECDLLDEAKQKCYLFKFYDENSNIVFSKIGTTVREIRSRLNEEIKSYRKAGSNIYKAIVCSVFDCGELPAEGAESITRAEFIKQFPQAFRKNDRFEKIDIPTENFNKIVNSYLKG